MVDDVEDNLSLFFYLNLTFLLPSLSIILGSGIRVIGLLLIFVKSWLLGLLISIPLLTQLLSSPPSNNKCSLFLLSSHIGPILLLLLFLMLLVPLVSNFLVQVWR